MRPFAVAAKRGERTQQRKFWNDQIDNLRRLYAESAFAKEIGQRIGRLVICYLQNSLVDREDDDLARTIGLVADVQRFARLCFCCGLEIDLEPAVFNIRDERDDAITERADENFFGIERPDKRDIHIAAALKTLRQTNVLNAARGVRLKPVVAVDFFSLDRDETVTAVGRGHADRNFIAGVVLFGVEFDLQLGVFLQRTGSCGMTHH